MSGLHRVKRPDLVREAVLRQASRIAVESGIQTITLKAVADRAGVTKGGLMHHFPDKAALLFALRERALSKFSDMLEKHIETEKGEGRFTRAYIRTCLATTGKTVDLHLIAAMWGDPGLRADWYSWLNGQEVDHADTDGSTQYKLLRLAADGAWLAAMDGANPSEWEAELLAMSTAA